MKRIFSFLLTVFISTTLSAQTVQYVLSMPQPHTHYYQVDMSVKGYGKPYLDVKMPVWAPGSYLVREFARHVDEVKATSSGKKLSISKLDKNTWRIQTGGSKDVLISYSVYAFELSVRTSFLDDTHGFVSGTSVFMYVNGLQSKSGTLKINKPDLFSRVSTSLELKNDLYHFSDYDELADCPIEIGNQDIFFFDAAGVTHEVAMYGEGNYDKNELKKGMAKVVEECTKVFGENPNKKYTFIIHNLTNPSGGLEHKSSTTLQVNRFSYGPSQLKGFYSLVAHEYFHLWNVKRLRPKALGPFNYDAENYTNLLWVSEGFTSYYDDLLMKRCGFTDENSYLRSLSSTISSVENQPGSKVQSLAESSHDAWIKAYRPDENSFNTTISYYPKGNVIAALLDIEIIAATKGEKKLDDLMKNMYQEFFLKKKTGFTDEDLIRSVNKLCGMDMRWFFDQYVYSAGPVDYNKHFTKVGYACLENRRTGDPSLEIRTNGTVITRVTAGGSAYEAGLNVNDEIIAIDDFRVDANTLNEMMNQFKVGETIDVMISRDNVIRTIKVKLKSSLRVDFNLSALPNEDPMSSIYFNKWMN